MLKPESTILEYTKSVEELRLFNLEEECSKVIHEYELFNIENGIYEKFGEWFLEEAKNSYYTQFSSDILKKIISESGLNAPENHYIECKSEDYGKCEKIRIICVEGTICRGRYRTSYSWYTMWQIAKAYNCKHGCVVTKTPFDKWNTLVMEFDWSQDAIDCITKEKWRSKAEKEECGIIVCGLFGDLVWLLIWTILALAIGITKDYFIGINSFLIPVIPFFVLFAFPIRNLSISSIIKKMSKFFDKHCEFIKETKSTEFDVRRAKWDKEYLYK